MEEIKYLSGLEELEKFREQQKQPEHIQRFLYYSQKLYTFRLTTKKETDTHIYWSANVYKPMFNNNKLFLLRQKDGGVTYDKEKKTIKSWFGNKISKDYVITIDIISHFKIEWLDNIEHFFNETATASLLQRCIRGKITNPRDYVKAVIKGKKNLRESGVSPEMLYKFYSRDVKSSHIHSVQNIIYKLTAFTNPDKYLELAMDGSLGYHMEDMIRQARILNKKINPSWSVKRLNQVHSDWTREIMGMEIHSVAQIDFNYTDDIEMPEGLSIIPDNRSLFEEGTIMKHCIYTNYAGRIKENSYFAFRYDLNGVRATLGVIKYYTQLDNSVLYKFDQMYGIGNSMISDDIKSQMVDWLEESETQEWLGKQNKSITETKTKNYEVVEEFNWL